MNEIKKSIMDAIYNGVPFERWVKSDRCAIACKQLWNEILSNMNSDAENSNGTGYGEQLSESEIKKILRIK